MRLSGNVAYWRGLALLTFVECAVALSLPRLRELYPVAESMTVNVENFFSLGLALCGWPCSWACSKRYFFRVDCLDCGNGGIDGGGFLGRQFALVFLGLIFLEHKKLRVVARLVMRD